MLSCGDGGEMKPGEVYEWLDQGPAILLSQCSIPAPCREEDFVDFLIVQHLA